MTSPTKSSFDSPMYVYIYNTIYMAPSSFFVLFYLFLISKTVSHLYYIKLYLYVYIYIYIYILAEANSNSYCYPCSTTTATITSYHITSQ